MTESIYSTGLETLGTDYYHNNLNRQETITKVLTELRQQPISRQITTQTEHPDPIEEDVEIVENEFTLKNCGVLLCTFFIFFVSWGFNASTGQFLSPIAAIFQELLGYQAVITIGNVLMFMGFMVGYKTKTINYLYTWAFFVGVGISFSYVPATTLIPKIFVKNRALALSFILMGTGLGAVVASLLGTFLKIDQFLMSLAIIQVVILSISTAVLTLCYEDKYFVKRNLRGWNFFKEFANQFKKYYSVEIFKSYIANLIAIWFNVALMGYLIFIFSLTNYTKFMVPNVSRINGNLITVFLNIGQIVGRPTMGRLGDKFGRANITIIFTFLCAIFIWVYWLNFTKSYAHIVGFAVLMGMSCGVANVFNTVLIADVCQNFPPEDNMFMKYWAYVNSTYAIFLLFAEYFVQILTISGPNVTNPYKHSQFFSGSLYIFALLLAFFTREYKIRTIIDTEITKTKQELEATETKEEFFEEQREQLQIKLTALHESKAMNVKSFVRRALVPIVV
ncbi:hypothetical protein FOG48_03461 [Hanseniaspora uvarum]|nr:hypothetical protein FOG48_03461 [Hanseniaspora uvarum]